MEFTLLFAALTGVAAAWIAGRVGGRRTGSPPVDRPTELLIGAAALGIFAGRLVEMVSAGVNPLTNPLDVLLVRGGVDTVTASAVAVVTVVWTLRARPKAIDALAPAALAGLAGWHAGCVWTDSCLGAATGTDLGFALAGSDVLRHPTELYAAAILLAGALVVARTERSSTAILRPTGLAIAIAGSSRLVTQPLRPAIGSGPVAWYALAVVAGVVLVIVGPRVAARLNRGA